MGIILACTLEDVGNVFTIIGADKGVSSIHTTI